MKHLTRDRWLTPEEAAKYDKVREQVAAELPELIERHNQRMIAIPCLCGRTYCSPRGPSHQCPLCKRRWLTLEPMEVTPAALARLAVAVKDAWARREREYAPIPDLKTHWPCGRVPYSSLSTECA
jgi:hypothetical protein